MPIAWVILIGLATVPIETVVSRLLPPQMAGCEIAAVLISVAAVFALVRIGLWEVL